VQTDDRGVLYIGRVPHGFYEEQMKEYFSQFGNVTRLRLARNKKVSDRYLNRLLDIDTLQTGRSKHYAFIEFDSSSVAKIVSETMDSYLIAGHLLQCKVVPADKVHPDLWIGSNKKWRLIPKGRLARLAHNRVCCLHTRRRVMLKHCLGPHEHSKASR
jgi:nucleolar protein 15